MAPKTFELTIRDVVKTLNLEPHPEGGYFTQTFSDDNTVTFNNVPSRSASTMIYFLLTPSSFSRIHRLDAAEGWHYYAGHPIDIVELQETGVKVTRLGKDLLAGERPQYIVKENTWFGSIMTQADRSQDDGDGTKWSLVGCTVAPAFEWSRFELGDSKRLLQEFGNCTEWIKLLTPPSKE